MPIKFRRIEDRTESVVQVRRRKAGSGARRHALPKLVVVAVIAAIAVAAVVYLRPPRIVAPFLVHVGVVKVASPVDGTVTWLMDKQSPQVGKGDVIARVVARPQAAGSVPARLTDLGLRQAETAADAATQTAERDALEVRLAEQRRQLGVTLEQARERLVRAELSLKEAVSELTTRRRDAETAQRLRRLGAMTEDDYAGAQRALQTAQVGTESAHSRLRGLRAELASAGASLEEFATVEGSALKAAESRVRGAQDARDAVQEAAEPLAAALSEDRAEYLVRSPADGVLLELGIAVGTDVSRGATLMTLYEPATKVARAYVPVRYLEGLHLGAKSRLYAKGRAGSAEGEVVFIHDRVVPLPGGLSQRVGYKEPNVLAVDIRLTSDPDGLFAPGQAGKAVIRK